MLFFTLLNFIVGIFYNFIYNFFIIFFTHCCYLQLINHIDLPLVFLKGELKLLYQGKRVRFPQLKEINGLFAFLLHFADKTVVDFNLLGAGVAFVFYGFMDDNLLDQGIQQFGSQF